MDKVHLWHHLALTFVCWDIFGHSHPYSGQIFDHLSHKGSPLVTWLSPKGIPHHHLLSSIPSGYLPVVSSSPYSGIALQSLHSSSQMPHIPVDLHPCLGHIRLRHRLSVWFSLRSDSHRWAASLSDSLRRFPSAPTCCPNVENSSLLQFPHHVGAGLIPLTILLFLPSFLCPTRFHVYLCIPFWWLRTPANSELMLCEICVWRCIPEAAVERDALYIHLLLRH